MTFPTGFLSRRAIIPRGNAEGETVASKEKRAKDARRIDRTRKRKREEISWLRRLITPSFPPSQRCIVDIDICLASLSPCPSISLSFSPPPLSLSLSPFLSPFFLPRGRKLRVREKRPEREQIYTHRFSSLVEAGRGGIAERASAAPTFRACAYRMHRSIFSSLPREEAGRLVGKAVRLLGMRIQGN